MHFKKNILLLLLILSSIIGNSQTVIKMKNKNGVSVIPCKVNGLPLNFIFDTGASSVSLSMTEASFMYKNGFLSKQDITGTQNFSDANGDISEGITVNIKEIEIGGLKLYNVEASIVKNNKAPLLLGQSAISKLGEIKLNLKDNTLTILNGKMNNVADSITIVGIIGTPKRLRASYLSYDLVITQYDFPEKMNWNDAKKACISLGKDWRLPTQDELKVMYQNKDQIGEFYNINYWSSIEQDNNLAWLQGFYLGLKTCSNKNVKYGVRAVRAFY